MSLKLFKPINWATAPAIAAIAVLTGGPCQAQTTSTQTRPNIVYIMADDHAAHAISAYGSKVNETPGIDRIGKEGMVLERVFATNALCAPSRATILTSKYSHINGTTTHQSPPFDGSQLTYPKVLQKNGYQTAVIGKWHLKSDPTGFDYWNILPGQGAYINPAFIENGERKKHKGYVTDLIADFSINWLEQRDKEKPFLLVCQHKAPHREWEPDQKHWEMFKDKHIPQPETYNDDYSSRSQTAKAARLRVYEHMRYTDVKSTPPEGMSEPERRDWWYQMYMRRYLACVASVDDNVARLVDYLEKENLLDNTVVIYTSDQGMFLGDHGWYDKRFMYDHSSRMPFLIRYPKVIKAGTRTDGIVSNVDFAPTMLDLAGIEKPEEMQGKSFKNLLEGGEPEEWQDSFYYHFHEYPDADHYAGRHYGIRNERYKLIHYYYPFDEWEFFDLEKDPNEMRSVYALPEYQDEVAKMKAELKAKREQYKDNTGTPVE